MGPMYNLFCCHGLYKPFALKVDAEAGQNVFSHKSKHLRTGRMLMQDQGLPLVDLGFVPNGQKNIETAHGHVCAAT